MSTKRYLDAGVATLSTTGDFGVVALNNPHFALTDRVTIHRTEVQECRTPDRDKIPPGTLSQMELIELPEIQKHQGIKTKWVIAHWLVHPETREKIVPHPWEAFYCLTDCPTATKEDYLRAWQAKKKEWEQHGCFTLKEYQERIRKETQRQIKKASPSKGRSCRDEDLEAAKLRVLEKVMPHTVKSIRTRDGKAGERFEHESNLPLGELEAVDYAIVKAYTSSQVPPSAKALSDYVRRQTGKSYSPDAIKKRRERLGLVGGKTGPPPNPERE